MCDGHYMHIFSRFLPLTRVERNVLAAVIGLLVGGLASGYLAVLVERATS